MSVNRFQPVRIRNLALGLIRKNLALKSLSLILALSFWAWVKAEEVVEFKGRVNVEYLYPDGIVPVEPGPRSVTVTLSGALGKMATLDWDGLAIQVDASDSAAGELSIDFTDRSIQGLSRSIDVERISPPALDLQLDLVMSRDTYIEPIVVGSPAPGYEAGIPAVTPSTIEISGPESLVQGLVAVKTDFVDITGAELDLDVVVDIVFESRAIQAETRQATVHIPMQPIISSRQIDDIPVRIEGNDWVAEPAYISASWEGPVLELQELVADHVWVQVRPPAAPSPDGTVNVTRNPDPTSPGFSLQHLVDSDEIHLTEWTPKVIQLTYQPSKDGDPESPSDRTPSEIESDR